jgi:hypothetical protein
MLSNPEIKKAMKIHLPGGAFMALFFPGDKNRADCSGG